MFCFGYLLTTVLTLDNQLFAIYLSKDSAEVSVPLKTSLTQFRFPRLHCFLAVNLTSRLRFTVKSLVQHFGCSAVFWIPSGWTSSPISLAILRATSFFMAVRGNQEPVQPPSSP